MKTMNTVLAASLAALSALVSQAQAAAPVLPDTGLLEPVTFMRCKPAQTVYDAGVSVALVRERVGSRQAAVVSTMTIAGTTSQVFHKLKSRPKIVEGDMAVGTIYEASTETSSFELTVDFFHADPAGVSPSTLKLDGGEYDLVCEPLATVF